MVTVPTLLYIVIAVLEALLTFLFRFIVTHKHVGASTLWGMAGLLLFCSEFPMLCVDVYVAWRDGTIF